MWRNREFLRKKLKKNLIGFNVFNKGSFYACASGYQSKGFAFLQTTKKTIDYYGIKNIVNLRRECERDLDIPIFLHLDHGDKRYAIEAIKNGYDSVMVDYSKESLRSNMRKTREILDAAWKREILVEAEVGELGGFSQEEEVGKFISKVPVDMLAVSIGSKHGILKDKIKPEKLLDFLPYKVPLVLHGASYIFNEDVKIVNKNGGKLGKVRGLEKKVLKQCIKNGIKKMNMDSVLRISYMAGLRGAMKKNPSEIDMRKLMSSGEEQMYKRVQWLVKEFVG